MKKEERRVKIAIIGGGPTALYAFQELLKSSTPAFSITVFERQAQLGTGMPYSEAWCDLAMLANIASIEFPALPQRLLEWVLSLSDETLQMYHLSRTDLTNRTFLPRILIGRYFATQFDQLIGLARRKGIRVSTCLNTPVSDVRLNVKGVRISFTDESNTLCEQRFDYVIAATGHKFDRASDTSFGYFSSPYPAASLKSILNCAVGIRGSGLSAIDATVSIAVAHGQFVRTGSGALSYRPFMDTSSFHITMLSRKGLLPEADFFCPIPYEPLAICTPGAIGRLIKNVPHESLLDAVFEFLRSELLAGDPHFAEEVGLSDATLEEFCAAYFKRRSVDDVFRWARTNLDEAKTNHQLQTTIAWRHILLRLHEAVEPIVPHLGVRELERFTRHLKPVLVDAYAAGPHESIERLLALHDAGKLSVETLSEKATVHTTPGRFGVTVVDREKSRYFAAFIEATGQRALGAVDVPFPSLKKSIKDAAVSLVQGGISVNATYCPISSDAGADRLFLLGLPYLLTQRPFIQGLTSSAAMAATVVRAIEKCERDSAAARQPIVSNDAMRTSAYRKLGNDTYSTAAGRRTTDHGAREPRIPLH